MYHFSKSAQNQRKTNPSLLFNILVLISSTGWKKKAQFEKASSFNMLYTLMSSTRAASAAWLLSASALVVARGIG